MKKLLNLLSILTITGTSLPTVIAANPYQKGNKKLLNSDIKNLKRIKRSDFPSLQKIWLQQLILVK